VLVTQSNHVVMDVSYDDAKMAWTRMQLKATCNISTSTFNDWFTGHLNFQIEHQYVLIIDRTERFFMFSLLFSLFPTMPRHNLYKIQPAVIELCQKYNIPYVVKPMGRAFVDILL
jgi:hypothetical protein